MKCPNCKKEIEKVRIYSECWQYGTLEKNTVSDYGSIEDILETVAIECPECNADIINSIEQ